MFAHFISQYPTQRPVQHIVLRTQLSIAMGIALSLTALQVQADDATQELTTALGVPVTVTDASVNSTAQEVQVSSQGVALFAECTKIQTSAARLACFDNVAQQGMPTNVANTKRPVDLGQTLKSTISGKPKVVLAPVTANKSTVTLTTDTVNNEKLNTVGLTQAEAQTLESVGVTQEQIEQYTPLSLAYDLDKNSERGTWTVRPYNPNYVLPLFYTLDPNLTPDSSNPDVEADEFTSNDTRNTELKFQVSFKSKVGEDLFDTNADLWFGYTQQSHWQVYNEDNSRPFRATDYQPEIFLTQPVTANLPFGGRLRMLGAGAIHHSNGQDDPLSRSWNRAYLMAGAEWGKLSIIPKVWTRISEDSEGDDNPDIEDFMSYGDLTFLYDLPSQQSLSGTLRYNPSTNKGAAQIDYVYPLTTNVNGYIQLFQGYGESIIDYNYENTSIGFGIVLNDWKGF